ncbi:hypothetical protein NDU88_005461, partial [Pleurodeles waltl]
VWLVINGNIQFDQDHKPSSCRDITRDPDWADRILGSLFYYVGKFRKRTAGTCTE